MRNAMRNQNFTHAAQQPGRECATAGQPLPDTLSAPAYSEEAVAKLRFMIQEEKLAGDLYEAFHEQTGLNVFAAIAHSEDRHMASLVAQAERAGIDVSDLTALPKGQFQDAGLQAMYTGLLAAGSLSSEAALDVGREVESADISDLTSAMADVASTPLVGVYERLSAGSEHHLAAFEQWLAA